MCIHFFDTFNELKFLHKCKLWWGGSLNRAQWICHLAKFHVLPHKIFAFIYIYIYTYWLIDWSARSLMEVSCVPLVTVLILDYLNNRSNYSTRRHCWYKKKIGHFSISWMGPISTCHSTQWFGQPLFLNSQSLFPH